MGFYGQWDPPADKVLLINYFESKKDGFFIECGASDGLQDSTCRYFEEIGWHGINMEPSKQTYEKLRNGRPKSINLNMALADKDGSMQFNDVNSPTGAGAHNGSLKHTEFHKKELEQYGCKIESYEVPTKTLASLVNTMQLNKIDLMVLDVEGFEVNVLNGMDDCEILPTVMSIEYPYSGLSNIKNKMDSLGYRFDFISYNNAYFSIGYPEKTSWFGETEEYKIG